MNTEKSQWFIDLFDTIISEEPWSEIEIIQSEDGEGETHWNKRIFYAPFEKTLTSDIEQLTRWRTTGWTSICFASENATDVIQFKNKEGVSLEDQLYTWTMQGPLDRGFIKHWKSTKE